MKKKDVGKIAIFAALNRLIEKEDWDGLRDVVKTVLREADNIDKEV